MPAMKLPDKGPPRGEAHANAKLTTREVRRMRRLHGEGYGYDRLSTIFGVSKPTVQRVILRRTWAHVA